MKLLVLALVFGGVAVCAAEPIRVDGQTPIAVACVGPGAKELGEVKALLRRHLPAALGREQLAGGSGPPLTIVLEAQALVWHHLEADQLQSPADIDAYTISVDAEARELRIAGGTVMGTAFGVIDFLREVVGVDWLFPGDLGTHIPESGSFVIEGGWSRRPAVFSRLYTGMLYPDLERRLAFRQTWRESPIYEERLFFEAYDYFKSLKLHMLASVSHNMINIFPVAYAKDNPELLPMLPDGTRYQPPDSDDVPGGHDQAWHPCYSNPLAVLRATDYALRAFDKGAFAYSLGINDGKRVQCQCATCQAIGWPASYYQFVTAVAKGCAERYPPHLIGLIVYGDVRHPEAEMKLPENVICVVSGKSELATWTTHASHLGRYEYMYGDGFAVPCFPLASLKHNAAIYASYGVAAFRAEAYPTWAFDAPKIYLQSRLLWTPEMDIDGALRTFCERAYGPAAEPMEGFYRLWGEQWDYLVTDAEEPAALTDMGLWRNSQAQFGRFPEAVFHEADRLMDEALALAAGGKQGERVAMVGAFWQRSYVWWQQSRANTLAFAPDEAVDLRQHLALLDGLHREELRLEGVIEKHPEWSVGASIADRGGWSLDKESHAARLSTLWRLRQGGELADEAELSPALRPYLAEVKEDKVARIKAIEKGTYYALPEQRDRFTPMRLEDDAKSFAAVMGKVMPRVPDERPRGGELTQHYAAALASRERAFGPTLLIFELEVSGSQGELSFSAVNLWPQEEGDGLPLNTVVQFGEEATTRRRVMVTEPVGMGSWRKQQVAPVRLQMLFTPSTPEATCRISVRVRQVDLAQTKAPEPELTAEEALEDLLNP